MKKLCLLLFVCFMAVSYGQQVIGSFPTMDGGFEGEASSGAITSASTIASGSQSTIWTTSSSNLGTYQTTVSRTGTHSVNYNPTSTTKRLQSPTAGNGLIANTTAYTIQFYYRTAGSGAPGGTPQIGVSPDGTTQPGTYVAITLNGTSGAWTKFTGTATSGTSAASPKYGVGVVRCSTAVTNSFDIDDFCMYLGAVDVTAPDAATSPNFTNVASTQMTVNWTAPGTGVDGGGYLVVRGSSDPTTAPNVNGIYAIGNTVAAGQQVVYIGTATSFIDNGLSSNTHYYYRIYTVDKAFNYSSGVALDGLSGAPSFAAEPTVQASNITFANVTSTSFDINWTNSGNGSNHLVVVKSGSAVDANPADGGSYTASNTLSGSVLGTGNYVVYNGTGNTVSIISGLTKVTKYYVSIFEFNGSGGTENYLLTSPPTGSQTTLPAEISSNGTAGSGATWATTSIWTGGAVPGPGDNVTVVAGDKIQVAASASCYNLTIQSGGKVYNNVALPTSSLVYLTIYGTTATINGTLGDKTDGAVDCAMGINFNNNLTISGTGLIRPARLRPNTNAQNVTLTFNSNTEMTYTGSTGNGGAAIYTDNSGNDNITVTVNPGKTLSFVDYGNLNTQSSTAVNGTANTIFNINGTVNMLSHSNISIAVASGKTSVLNVNSTLNIGNNLITFLTGGGTTTLNVGASGSLLIGGTSDFSSITTNFASGSILTFNSAGNQTIPAVPYSNLTISGGGTKTLTGTASVSGALTINPGSTLDATTSNITISGPGLAWNNTGTFTCGTSSVKLQGTSAQSMYGSTFYNLEINNPAGVTLTSSDIVNNQLTLTSGTLTLGSNNLTVLGSISGATASNYIVTNGTGTLIQPVTSASVAFPVGLATDYTPVAFSNTSTARNYGVKVLSVTPSGLAGGLARQWFVQEATHPDNTVFGPITLTWNATAQGTLNNANPCDVVANTTGNVNSYDLLGLGLPITGSSVTFTPAPEGPILDITGGLYITVVQPNSTLPVELSSFTSDVNGRNVNLNWSTKTEKNSDKFVIERKTTAEDWINIGFVRASVLSNSPKQYSFSDNNLQTGKYQYRLKMIDNNGSFQYSNLVEIEVSLPKNFELSQNYPNPFNPSTVISYSIPVDSKVTLEVYSLNGERIARLVNQNQAAGFYSVNFINKNISSGVYFYHLVAVDQVTGNSSSSIKKMMLMK